MKIGLKKDEASSNASFTMTNKCHHSKSNHHNVYMHKPSVTMSNVGQAEKMTQQPIQHEVI